MELGTSSGITQSSWPILRRVGYKRRVDTLYGGRSYSQKCQETSLSFAKNQAAYIQFLLLNNRVITVIFQDITVPKQTVTFPPKELRPIGVFLDNSSQEVHPDGELPLARDTRSVPRKVLHHVLLFSYSSLLSLSGCWPAILNSTYFLHKQNTSSGGNKT